MRRVLKLLTLSLVTLVSCSHNIETEKVDYVTIIPEEHEYSEISEYELLWESMFEVEEDHYVYIYSLTCSHCNEIKNDLIEIALKRGDIYFVKGTSKDQISNDVEKSKNAENPGDIWILGYPTLLKIENKKCTKNIAGKTQIMNEIKL